MFLYRCTNCDSVLKIKDDSLKFTWQICPVCNRKICLCANTGEDGEPLKSHSPQEGELQKINRTIIVLLILFFVVLPIVGIMIFAAISCQEVKKAEKIYNSEMNRINRDLRHSENEYQREMRKINRELREAEEDLRREIREIESYDFDSYDY